MKPPLHPLAFTLSLALHAGALGGVVLLAGNAPPLPLAVVEIDMVPAAVFVVGDEPDGAPRAPAGSLVRETSRSVHSAFQPRSGSPRSASIEAAASTPASTGSAPSPSRQVKPSRSGLLPQIAAISPDAHQSSPARRQSKSAGKPSAPSVASRSDATGSEVALLAAPAAAAAGALAPEGPRASAASLANVRPKYPESARRAGIEGRVVLRVTVTAGGSSEVVVVEESSGHALLDRSALSAVRRWRFLPATRGGVAVAGEIAIPILFRLDDG